MIELFDPEHDAGEFAEGEEALGELVVSDSDASVSLEFGEKVVDVPPLLEGMVR